MMSLKAGQMAIMPTKDEAEWLRDLCQNPIYDDETAVEARNRGKWFEILKEYVARLEPPTHIQCENCFRSKSGFDPNEDIPF
jgi:hypothetical protein